MEKNVTSERANKSLKMFLTLLKRLAASDSLNFSLVIGAANSGISITYLYDIALSHLRVTTPKYLYLPIFRAEKIGYDVNHESLLTNVTNALNQVDKSLNILFLDDEIGAGTAAHIALDLLVKAAEANHLSINRYTIIAEDLGFQNTYRKDIEVEFIPILKHPLDNVYNVLSGLIPAKLSKMIQAEVPEQNLRRTEVFNIALGLPIKIIEKKKPSLRTVELSTNLQNKCREFQNELKEKIKNTLDGLE